jgi:phage tail-like protein
MARSAVVDPLEKFRFQITWTNGAEGTTLVRAGFHDMQMPKRTTNKGTYREGIDPDVHSLYAGLSTMEDVVLSRGVISNDPNDEFYSWMSAVHNPGSTDASLDVTNGKNGRSAGQTGALEYRKDVTVTMLDREGKFARSWILSNAWPSHFVPGSDLNAGEDGEKSLESLTLAYEDFYEVDATGNKVTKTSPSLP